MRLSQVIIFGNGNTAMFDEDGNQMPEQQRSIGQILMLYAELKGCGSDSVGVLFHPNTEPIQFTKRINEDDKP